MRTNHRDDVQRYVDGVQDGSIVTGRLVKAAVRRYLTDLATGSDRGIYHDADEANYAISAISCLGHSSGEYDGQPFNPRLFQKFIFWNLLGWKRANGTRRFRKAFISMARGNGKSPVGAAIGNYCFRADRPTEPRAEVYSFATKEKQARIVFDEAANQIRKSRSRSLKNCIVIQRANMHIPSNGSKFEPLGSDSQTSDGWSIHCAILDELHAWGDHHRGLYDAISTAMGKRRQPLKVTITTAGNEESLLWLEEKSWAESVVMGAQEQDDLFVYIAEIDTERECAACDGKGCDECEDTGRIEVDCLDESEWPAANPMLNEPNPTVKIEELRTSARKARKIPAELNRFKRFYANQIIGSLEKVYSLELWNRGNKPLGDLDGRPCFAGFDAGHKKDLASLVLVFPFPDLRQIHAKVFAWLPSQCDYDLHSEPWVSFINSGELTITDGNSTDTEAVWQTMRDCVARYQIQSLAFDPCNAREFGTRCVNEWALRTYGFSQSASRYNEPMNSLEDALQTGQFHHGGNRLLAWCANNTVAHRDSMNRRMPSKLKSKNKIDPVVALLMAFSEMRFAERTSAPIEAFTEVIYT